MALPKNNTHVPSWATQEKRACHFIERAKQIHGNTYDYSRVLDTFTKQQANVTILCKKCGPFEQLATNHLAGKGCLTCAAKKRMEKRYPEHYAALQEGNKICGCCKTKKVLNAFSPSSQGSGNVSGWCRICENNNKKTKYKSRIRNSNLKKYNLTNKSYLELLEKQEYKCKICGVLEIHAPGVGASPGILCVDHDHKTNKVRGLLCSHCNTGLGLFFDDVSNLQNAITYLNSNSDQSGKT